MTFQYLTLRVLSSFSVSYHLYLDVIYRLHWVLLGGVALL